MSTTLHVYTTPPHKTLKAADECREAGIRPFVPMETREHLMGIKRRLVLRQHPLMPGYLVTLGTKPRDAKYIRDMLGSVNPDEMSPLYKYAVLRKLKREPSPFRVGDIIRVKVGPFAEMTGTLAKKRGRRDWTVEMATKSIGTITVKTDHMVRIDPG